MKYTLLFGGGSFGAGVLAAVPTTTMATEKNELAYLPGGLFPHLPWEDMIAANTFFACLIGHVTSDYASLSCRSTIFLLQIERPLTSVRLLRFFDIFHKITVCYLIPLLFRRLRTPSISHDK